MVALDHSSPSEVSLVVQVIRNIVEVRADPSYRSWLGIKTKKRRATVCESFVSVYLDIYTSTEMSDGNQHDSNIPWGELSH